MSVRCAGTAAVPIVAKNAMLENATVAISPKAPTAAKANPAVEYISAANIACRIKLLLSVKHTVYTESVARWCKSSHQPASEGVGLEGFRMPPEKDLILRSVGPNVAE